METYELKRKDLELLTDHHESEVKTFPDGLPVDLLGECGETNVFIVILRERESVCEIYK